MKVFDRVVKDGEVEKGEVVVAHDPQKRLGDPTWLVFVQGDGTLEGDTVEKGLFWDKELALRMGVLVKFGNKVLLGRKMSPKEYFGEEKAEEIPDDLSIIFIPSGYPGAWIAVFEDSSYSLSVEYVEDPKKVLGRTEGKVELIR